MSGTFQSIDSLTEPVVVVVAAVAVPVGVFVAAVAFRSSKKILLLYVLTNHNVTMSPTFRVFVIE